MTWHAWSDVPEAALRIGISACLLGSAVRYDGGHERDAFLVERFGRLVEWLPVCPEVELGLGIPRETVRLERDAAGLRLVAPKSGSDHTRAMHRFAAARVAALGELGIAGYVLKTKSPSCGLARVKVHRRDGAPPRREGRGLFAAVLLDGRPLLPVMEEGQLQDPLRRESFVARAFVYRRLQHLFSDRFTHAGLERFHAAHELLLRAHSPEGHPALGRLVAQATRLPVPGLLEAYGRGVMGALAEPATVSRQADVLQRCVGHLGARLDPRCRTELTSRIDEYRRGLVPLGALLDRFRDLARALEEPFLMGQIWLFPSPRELAFRHL